MNMLKHTLAGAGIATLALACSAQVDEAWVARYNGGFSNRTHVPMALLLDSPGNACVAGSSQNAAGVYDYLILRYAPNGARFPVVRYSSSNALNCSVNDLALDQAGNAYVTGSGGTAKFATNGTLVWTASYAGNGIAVDSSGNTYVTGFSTNEYATVKLDPSGSNLWVQTYVSPGTFGAWSNASQRVAVDGAAGVFVAGWESYGPEFLCSGQPCRYARPSMLKYDSSGTCLWTNPYAGGFVWGQTKALIPDGQGGAYVAASSDYLEYLIASAGPDGGMRWSTDLAGRFSVTAMALARDGYLYSTGTGWFTAKLVCANGQDPWYTYQSQSGQGNAIAPDPAGCLYAAGSVPTGPNSADSALIRYDPANGNQLWTKRYDGPAHGDDGAVAMAIAPDGSIYVTGYSANTNGGSDIFVIKYVPAATIERRSDASMRVEFSGLPGQACGLEASTDLVSWATLGLVNADTNGVFQFDDTNAPFLPHRFYRWHYP